MSLADAVLKTHRSNKAGIMKNANPFVPLVVAGGFLLSASAADAQICPSPAPAMPSASTTATQDRDYMLCQLGLRFPVLPVRSGTAWPWNDPTAPTNARPTSLSTPEGNWTDPQGHVVVRTNWGAWHTYDAEPIYEPDPSVHYTPGVTTWPLPAKNGGAMSGYGDYGPESTPRYTDIDLLKMKDGAPVTAPEDWWTKRRPEIFGLVQQELYGKPIDPTIPVTWTVGAVTTGTQVVAGVSYPWRQKTLTGTVDKSSYPALRNTPVITAQCRFPAATGKKHPVVITYGEGTNIFQFTAPYGIGTCSYTPTGVQPDSGNNGSLSSYIIGLVNKGNWRKPDDPGSLVAWAWGVSRLIDRFAADPDLDEDRVGVEGHSRYGKATLVTAAYDDRVTVAWPSDAGALGTALARRHYGESLEFVSTSTSEYHWVNGNIMSYGGRLDPDAHFPRRLELLDVDAHSTTSLVAPRAIFVTNGTDTPAGVGDAWADPRGCFLSGKLATPVWELLGWPGQVVPPGTPFTTPGVPGTSATSGPAESVRGTPAFDLALIDGTIGWRRQKEGHTPTPNWPTFARFASRYLNDVRPVVAAGQTFTLPDLPTTLVGVAQASDVDGDPLGNWQVTGGTGAYKFQLDRETGAITIQDRLALDVSVTSYDLTVMASDGKRPSKPQTVTILVPPDVAPPVFQSLSASKTALWPPNHAMVPVHLSAVVADNRDPAPTSPRIVSVTSNEAINGQGDGNTAPDWAITGDMTVELRAERSGKGPGRVYTITVESVDRSGNAGRRTVTVTVAHNQ